jgi:hypothetical protein
MLTTTEKESAMKRLLLLGFICLVFAVPVHAAEIYWDEAPPADPIITDADFTANFRGPKSAKSLEKMDVYDSGEVLELDYEKLENQPVAPAPARALAEPAVDRPSPERRVEPAPPRSTIRTKRTPAPASSGEETAPPRVEPSVMPSLPAPPVSDTPDLQIQRGTPVPAVGGEPTEPEPKRTPWGAEETKPGGDSQNGRFKWGQPK